MSRRLSITFCMTLLLLLNACGGGGNDPDVADPDPTAVVGVWGESAWDEVEWAD